MADTERPKRLRGAKLLEEGYRAGFNAGYALGKSDAAADLRTEVRRQEIQAAQLTEGLQRVRSELRGQPKRTRRAKDRIAPPPGPEPMGALERRAAIEQSDEATETIHGL